VLATQETESRWACTVPSVTEGTKFNVSVRSVAMLLLGDALDATVCSPSNDGLVWLPVGMLELYADISGSIYAGIIGGCAGAFVTLAMLAAYYWVRWRRLRKVGDLRRNGPSLRDGIKPRRATTGHGYMPPPPLGLVAPLPTKFPTAARVHRLAVLHWAGIATSCCVRRRCGSNINEGVWSHAPAVLRRPPVRTGNGN